MNYQKVLLEGSKFLKINNISNPNLDTELIDEVMQIDHEEAGEMARQLAREEGILCGISAGGNVYAAVEQAKRPENEGKLIVTIVCDTGERYLSTWLFEEE